MTLHDRSHSRTRSTLAGLALAVCCTPALALLAASAHAADPAFQAYFFSACSTPTGALTARCAETPGGLGNLSGDSESSLNPSQTLSTADSGLASVRAIEDRTQAHAERARDGTASDAQIQLGPFSLLVNARTGYEDSDRAPDSDTERGYESDTWGAELGFDYRVNTTLVVGVLATWESYDAEFDGSAPGVNFTPFSHAGEMNADRFGLVGFATLDTSQASYLQVSAGYTSADYDVTRDSVFQESTRTVPQTNARVRSNVDGTDTFAAATWGYLAEAGSWTLSPYVGVQYARIEADSYDETDLSGSGLAMSVDDFDRESMLGTIGMRIGTGISLESGVLLPSLLVEYAHEFDDDSPRSRTAFLLDTTTNTFALSGEDPDTDYFNVGLGLVFALPNGWQPFVDFQTTLGYEDLDAGRFTAGLRKEL